MTISGRKIGVLVSAAPAQPNFRHALRLAEEALGSKLDLYLYLIDEAVAALHEPKVLELQKRGAKVFVCAYSLQKRHFELQTEATLAGLTILSDIISASDRFVAFH